MNPAQVIHQLYQDELFQQWQKQHPQAYCSHFFCQIDPAYAPLSKMEIGFFDPHTHKITVFVELEKGRHEIKPDDDVFQRNPNDPVEALQLPKVKIGLPDAITVCAQILLREFSKEQLGNGFLILQTFHTKTVWNFTFISRTLKFLNVKVNAETGTEEAHEEMNLIQKS